MDLDALLSLRTAGEYSNPGDDLSPLPEVYGNFLSPDVGTSDSTDVATPARLIDRLNLVYCVNATRTASTPPVVMWNGKIQDASVYSWNPTNNYEGRGVISTLTFALNVVTTGVVSVRHGGAVDGTGVPITNPIQGIYDLLTRRGGWTLSDFDLGPSQISLQDMNALGYPFYFCFAEADKTIRDWLLELMPHYHTDFTETGESKLAFLLDRSLTTFTVQPDYHIPAYEIEDHGSPATAMTFNAHADDVANQVTLNGRHNWVTGESTASYTWDYVQSQSAYHAVYPMPFTFRGMYTMTHATQWLNSFAMRHGFEPRTVSFTMKGLKGIPLIPPRFVTVEWPLYGWVQHLLKIRKSSISLMGRRVRLECIDCQRELSDVVTSPLASPTQRRQQLSRLYTYVPGTVGNEGDLATAPSSPRNEAANGDFELGDNGQWDFYAGNAAKQWTVVDNDTETYQGRFSLRHVANAGNGLSLGLRTRIDPGEWVLVSAWFRQHTGGTNGRARAVIYLYDRNDVLMGSFLGSYVTPTNNYMESVASGQVPSLTYYYRPGMGFEVYPTAGQWRADYVRAVSGTQAEVIAARRGDQVTRNFVINGDFELGDLMYSKGMDWIITNDPAADARSGVWKAVHLPSPFPISSRLTNLTKISVTPGQTFTAQAWVMTLGPITGQAMMGVIWFDAQETLLSENSTTPVPGPFAIYTMGSGLMTVPANATYAKVWLDVRGHSGTGTSSLWLFDDLFISIG